MLWLMLLAADPSFVTADLVLLRDAPREGAVQARLRIGTPLVVHRNIGAFADVSIDTPTRTLRGFVPMNLIASEPETVDALEKKLESASTMVDAHFYAERLIALDPTEARASYLRARLPGVSDDISKRFDARPTLLAICEATDGMVVPESYHARVILLGAITRRGRLAPLAADEATRAQIEALPWFVRGSREPLAGSAFLGAKTRMSWNEEAEYEEPSDMVGGPQLVLGPCDVPGTVYATREIYDVPLERASPKESIEHVAKSALDRRYGRRLREIRAEGPVSWLLGHGALVPIGAVVSDAEEPDAYEGVIHNRDLVIGDRAVATEGGNISYDARPLAWFSFAPDGDRLGLIQVEVGKPEAGSSVSIQMFGVTPRGEVEPRGDVEIASSGC